MTENTTPPSAPEGVIVSNSPVPTPVPTTPNTNVVSQNIPNMESGGATNSSSWGDFLKSLNLIEVGFLILGVTSLYVIIYHYNRRTIYEKNQFTDIQKQLDEIKMNLRNSMKEKYKTI